MATSRPTSMALQGLPVADTTEKELVETLEKTIHAQVLKQLEDPLSEIVRDAVHTAIVVASKALPAKPDNLRPPGGAVTQRIFKECDKQLAQTPKDPGAARKRAIKALITRGVKRSSATKGSAMWIQHKTQEARAS